MTVKPFMTARSIARTAAALALLASVGLPAHAGDGGITAQCKPVECPKPPCSAVPEPASVALVGLGIVGLLPIVARTVKSRRANA